MRSRAAQRGERTRSFAPCPCASTRQRAGAPPAETNLLGAATRRGVSNAGILGNPRRRSRHRACGRAGARHSGDVVTGEPDPEPRRDNGARCLRLPTMGRRELSCWASQPPAGPRSSAADASRRNRIRRPRRGAAGGHGGRETQLTASPPRKAAALRTNIARMAARRTLNVVSRLVELNDARWEPSLGSRRADGYDPRHCR